VADVSRIETGRLTPYPSQAQKLGRVLGLKPEELQETEDAELLSSK
jgi:ribosome-binding protein aMBF1 (putative translation factor)